MKFREHKQLKQQDQTQLDKNVMAYRILIVDDQEALRRLVRMSLTTPEFGFEFEDAITGDEALLKLEDFQPDLVILDVMMPGSHSGFDVCRVIKTSPEHAKRKVILLSARGQKSDLEEGEAVAADAYLIKPFSPISLESKVRELLY